jgi:accessory gene regulator protein AgrB
MKIDIQLKRYVFIASLLIVFLLSGYIAFLTYRYYGIVARGIVGLVLIYRLLFWRTDSDPDIDIDTKLSDRQKGKYIILTFIIPMISYWAAAQIYEMVLFFGK